MSACSFVYYVCRYHRGNRAKSEYCTQLFYAHRSCGTPDDIDAEIERYRQFSAAGVKGLAIRLFDDPMDGLRMIGERVVPALA
jgi:hypothetical protein